MKGEESVIRRTPKSRPTFAGFRRFGRMDVRTHVTIQDEDGWELPLESVNISPTGMFVESQFLFEIGDEHTLIFCSPDSGEWFRITAKVVRIEDGDADIRVEPPEPVMPGMAYEFAAADPRALDHLRGALGA